MNREQVIQILATLKLAFPHSFQNLGRTDMEGMIELWKRQFAGEDPLLVSAAVDSLISSRTVGYSPNIGEIKEQMHRIRTGDRPSEVDAWTLVEKACRNGIHGAAEEFAKLPPDVQRVVGGPEQLKAWAMMDSETVNSVIASNFRKSYFAAQEREKQNAMMPVNVREMMAGVAEHLTIEQPKAQRLMPVKLEPMINMVAAPREEPQQPAAAAEYQPPDADSWERMRAAALAKLGA